MPPQQSPAKTLKLGQSNGVHDPASVRDKIRKWQTAGGGVLEQVDELAGSDKESKTEKKSSKSSGAGSGSGSGSGSKSRSSSSHAKSKSEGNIQIVDPPRLDYDDEPAAPPLTPSQLSKLDIQPSSEPPKPRIIERRPNTNKLDADVRDASAPKKRIVSDGHWRRKHSDPNAKPPSPTKVDLKKKEQFAWVRPPLLTRPSDEPQPPPSPPKRQPEPKPIKVYTGKGTTKPIATQIHSQLSKRPAESVPMRPRSPTTPRPRRLSMGQTPRGYKSEEESPPKTARSNQKRTLGGRSRQLDEAVESADEKPRTRLSKSRKTASEGYKSEVPTRRRSLSVGDALRPNQRQTSIQRSPDHYESAGEERERRQRRARHSDGDKSEHEHELEHLSDSPPHELNNYDDEAEKRRSTFRAEFAKYTPPRERKPSRRKQTTRRFSYSPERIDRLPEPLEPEPMGEPIPPQRQTSTRIEAWLTETPDPFKESSSTSRKKADSKRVFSFETRGRDAMTESTVETETTITETTLTDTTITDITESTIEPRSTSRKYASSKQTSRDGKRPIDRRVRAQSEPSDFLDPDIEIEYSSTTSVPTLKRSGARHGTGTPSPTSKTRSKPAKTVSSYTESYTESEITESVVSSSIDPRGFEKPGEDKSYNVARRLFPSTGKRLSTIVSVETLATKGPNASQPALAIPEETTEGAKDSPLVSKEATKDDIITALPDLADGSVVSAARSRTSLKRKLTTHADLMTVLSMPASRSKSIISARSIRTHKSRLETATVEDLMKELASDEAKYMRELRTLADGVIPILLKCVLSKSEAAVAAGLFKSSPHSEKDAVAEASKVIHDLSVAIQRLKSLHTRIPKENHFSLLIWAQSAQSVYERYIKTWRLGFQDVVVSLAPDTEGSTVSTPKSADGSGAWEKGLPLNEDGYVVDGDGERVDVAFLLRRPLVRLKFLSKTIKGINIKKPSEQAGVLAKKFETLMETARNKVNDEKARLEDEAAALIDATRARDPRSLAPLAGVRIDATRCVRARDFFDLHLPHSSGQTVDCRVELLARDDAPGRGKSGDILICEVDETDRWLLFPPVDFRRISARAGDEPGQIIVLLRGVSSSTEDWEELFTLTAEDEEIRFEWIQWLGLSPVPPPLDRTRSFKARPASSHASSSLLSESARTESTAPLESPMPSSREIDIPIGERAGSGAKRWSRDILSPTAPSSDTSSFLSSLDSERAILYEKKKPQYSDTGSYTSVSSYTDSDVRTDVTPPPPEPKQASGSRRTTPRSLNEAMEMAGGGSPTLKRVRAKRYRSSPEKLLDTDTAQNTRAAASAQFDASKTPKKKSRSIKKTSHSGGFTVWIPNSEPTNDSDSEGSDEEDSLASSYLSGRPTMHHRTSSVPSLKLPSVPRMRSSRRDDEYMSGALLPEPVQKTPPPKVAPVSKEPSSAPPKLERRSESAVASAPVSPVEDKPPPPPPHRTPSSSQVKFAPTPQFTPTSQLKRRSSSPLKHEYRPSSPSSESSYTEDEDSVSEYSQDSLTSESEDDDDELDDNDVASTFVSSVAPPKEPEKPADLYSLPNGTLKPSESASQAPYRTVPQVVAVNTKPSKCVASIFTWSDKGQWELLHPDDCSIVITPGLIAAYFMSPVHSTEALPEERPLVAQELTPLVPLRRGTALDITIRSPPTAASRLRPGSNVMFRSRSGEECEILYNLINRARINNPTYIALQNARPPIADGWAAAMERQNSQRGNNGSAGGFWSGMSRSKSYRASSRAHSTAGNTESSIRTMSSVITAMKRFSGSQFIMDKARSRMSISRDGTDSLGSGGSGTRSPPHFVAPTDRNLLSGGAGISNAKVRLYVLQSQNRWMDLGSAKLSILPKEEGAPIAAPIMLHTGVEKRIVVAKKRRGAGEDESLLDVTLPEMCFERWARTGIGVSVWVDVVDGRAGVADTGGVGDKRVVKYMIQLKSERECAYTFSLLGKLRY